MSSACIVFSNQNVKKVSAVGAILDITTYLSNWVAIIPILPHLARKLGFVRGR